MTGYEGEILAVAAVTACACALPGSFLVLRQSAMLSDAVSHAVLPGIVVAFLLTGSLTSPLLVLAAAATGLLTVVLVELLRATRLLREDAAIGLTFPVLFSVGVVLVSRFAGSVHLDTDSVLLGELAFAPFRRVALGGRDLGPEALWTMGAILALDLAFVVALYKELQLATFDPALGAALGFPPARLHYALMAVVSVTAVGAFDAVGSVLVVALMVAPPATARLLTDRLPVMLWLGALVGIASAGLGWLAAHLLDASIAGSMASAAGALFTLAFLFAPETGLVALARRRAERRRHFLRTMLAIHLLHHGDSPEADDECRVERLPLHLRWDPATVGQVVREAERAGEVRREGPLLVLTAAGRSRAAEGIAG